jgi:hypothetical protein
MKIIECREKAKTVMELTSNLIKKKLKEKCLINKELTSLRNKVSDSKKIEAIKPKETSSLEKPDYQPPRPYKHLLLMGPNVFDLTYH